MMPPPGGRYSAHMPLNTVPLELGSLRLTPWPRDISLLRRTATLAAAFGHLLWLDLRLALGYRWMRCTVQQTRTAPRPVNYDALTLVRVAVRDACVFYIKPVACLQRSAAVTRMLRKRGIPAELVIGHSPMPVHHHAWVEVDGRIVWDHMINVEYYVVSDRC